LGETANLPSRRRDERILVGGRRKVKRFLWRNSVFTRRQLSMKEAIAFHCPESSLTDFIMRLFNNVRCGYDLIAITTLAPASVCLEQSLRISPVYVRLRFAILISPP
jgi:hypothetical protein